MFSDDQPVHSVSVTELDRSVSAVLALVNRGERVIVTKHGMPVAAMFSISDAFEVMIAGSETFALLRREAREQFEAGLTVELPSWRGRRS
jgi:prevent-host-death family protein